MTSQRLVEDFARWLWAWDMRWEPGETPPQTERIPDGYLNHAAVFLAGELGQRLQHGPHGYVNDDADALDWRPPEMCCCAIAPEPSPFACTREVGHRGPHIAAAEGEGLIYQRWEGDL